MRPMNPTRARGSLVLAGALSIATVVPAMAQTTAAAPTTQAQGTTGSTGAEGAVPARPAKRHSSFSLRSARRNVTLGGRTLVLGTLRPA